MRRLLSIAVAAAFVCTAPAVAAAPSRIRGTIVSVSATTLTLQTTQGQTDTVQLTPATRYAGLTKSSLAAIQPGGYIGTATKTTPSGQVALEVVVFPPAMRGVGEGHYAWDTIADTTEGGTPVHSSMTNGSVMAAMPPRMTTSSMTNGTIAATTGPAGGKMLTVTYNGGQQTILVPPSAPVVTVVPETVSVLKPGASVFLVALPGANGPVAKFINVGLDGLKPPM